MDDDDVVVRLAVREDLESLLNVLPQITSRPGSPPATSAGHEKSCRILDEIVDHENVNLIVAELAGKVVAALTLVVVPNLMYEGRPWSIIENVVVSRDLRGRGIGKKLMAFAFAYAEKKGSYKVQLLSGPNDNQVGFYRSVGMKDGVSVGFKMYLGEH
jgi:GNAT superfamily N-acetyltransferase